MPMAGGGTRFGGEAYDRPKPLIELQGNPFFYWAVQSISKYLEDIDITFAVLEEHVKKYEIDKVIKKYYPQCQIAVIPRVLNGAVLTCLNAIEMIEDDLPVLFNDCDHAFTSEELNRYIKDGATDYAGTLVTFEYQNPNYSYVLYDNCHNVKGTVEKQVVSNKAICGAYLFRNKNTFVKAAKKYLDKCTYTEFFMSGVYDELINEGGNVVAFNTDWHVSFGTPEEYRLVEENSLLGTLI